MFRKEIPNILTLCNLLCGCASIYSVFSVDFRWAALFIFMAAVFDLFDGMVARFLGVSGPLGGELDSLADVVSFGVAPSFIAFKMISVQGEWLHYAAFSVWVMAACSAYRLARFNIDSGQKNSFRGMPTPANAVFWAALAMYGFQKGVFLHSYYLLAIALIMSFLLVSNFRMFAFKSRDWSWSVQKMIYLFLMAAAVLIGIFGFLGLAAAIILYPFFSWLHFSYRRYKELDNKR